MGPLLCLFDDALDCSELKKIYSAKNYFRVQISRYFHVGRVHKIFCRFNWDGDANEIAAAILSSSWNTVSISEIIMASINSINIDNFVNEFAAMAAGAIRLLGAAAQATSF